tara:strand:- start:185 stop:625 length:441 start_codon:yes stop_codon:yes gene_type:complete
MKEKNMKVTVIHMPHPADTESEAVRVAEVTIPAEITTESEACEYAYRWTQNIMGSWSKKFYDNPDMNDNVRVLAPLHEIDGELYGLRSSMMGDHFIVHSDNAWSHSEEGEVYECAMLGFEYKYKMTLVEFAKNNQTRAYGVERVEI